MAVYIYPPYQVTVDTGSLATAAKQDQQTALLTTIDADTGNIATSTASADTKLTTTNSSLASIDAKDFATETTLAAVNAKDFATETTLSAINAKITVVDTTGLATSAKQDSQTALLQVISDNTSLDVVDQLDGSPLLDTSGTNIPASSADPLELVATLAADVKKIISVEDIGSYMGLYTGAALSETLKCVLPLGGGEVEVQIPSGTRVSIRALENTAISSGKIAINFLG
jgi:hypothetical protein